VLLGLGVPALAALVHEAIEVGLDLALPLIGRERDAAPRRGPVLGARVAVDVLGAPLVGPDAVGTVHALDAQDLVLAELPPVFEVERESREPGLTLVHLPDEAVDALVRTLPGG